MCVMNFASGFVEAGQRQIAEAETRPTMRFVPIKDVAHHDIQALPRVRERLIGERTALINAVHGLLHA